MERKKDQGPRVPLGTFGSSQPPAGPAEPQGDAVDAAPPPPAGHVESPGPEAAAPKRYDSTLLGVPTPDAEGLNDTLEQARARRGSFPTPPTLQELGAQANGETVPAAPTAPAAAPPETSVSEAIEQMLEETPSVEALSAAGRATDEEELDLDAELDDLIEESEPVETQATEASAPAEDEVAEHSREPTRPTPVLLPEELAAAHARAEAAVVEESAAGPGASSQPDVEAAEQSKARASASERDTPKSPPEASPRPVAALDPALLASLAPAEIERQAQARDASAGIGFLLVAVMVVLGGGGWLLTQGQYQRAQRFIEANTKPEIKEKRKEQAAAKAVQQEPSEAPVPQAQPAAQPESESEPGSEAQQPPAKVSRVQVKSQRPDGAQAKSAAPAKGKRPVLKITPEAKSKQAAKPGASPQQPAPSVGAEPPAAELPDTPSRDAVVGALAAVQRKVAACKTTHGGVAEVEITVQNNGVVTHAVVSGDFAGTPEGSCVARAVREARFPPFQQPRFRVVYPFAL